MGTRCRNRFALPVPCCEGLSGLQKEVGRLLWKGWKSPAQMGALQGASKGTGLARCGVMNTVAAEQLEPCLVEGSGRDAVGRGSSPALMPCPDVKAALSLAHPGGCRSPLRGTVLCPAMVNKPTVGLFLCLLPPEHGLGCSPGPARRAVSGGDKPDVNSACKSANIWKKARQLKRFLFFPSSKNYTVRKRKERNERGKSCGRKMDLEIGYLGVRGKSFSGRKLLQNTA